MANGVTFKVNTNEFNATLRRYAALSKRDIPTIVNTKGWFIGRGACREAPKVNAAKIPAELRQEINGAPLAALIINKGRKPGLRGAEMQAAIKKLEQARVRGSAFLKAGWLPTIKKLGPMADRRGAPRTGPLPKQFGQDHGKATPAPSQAGWKAICRIENFAQSKRDRGGFVANGQPALQRAFNAETASMLRYMERKQREACAKSGIKLI